MAAIIWFMCIFAVTSSAGNFRKQKLASSATIKNATLVRGIYLTQQHILQHTRHHSLVANKTKVMKHNDKLDAIQSHFDESDELPNTDAPLPLKRFPLKNIPLYHAYYHQHTYNASDLSYASLRNRSSIRKRASAGEKQISTNITMVLEGLLKSYKSNYLPTHGQGVPTVVKTNILIRSMGPISELDMEYSMDCYFRQYWRDSRLKFQGPMKTLSLSIKMLDKIWKPDSTFFNGKHSYVHTITVPNKLLRLTQEGDILYSMSDALCCDNRWANISHIVDTETRLFALQAMTYADCLSHVLNTKRRCYLEKNRQNSPLMINMSNYSIRLTIKASCPMELRNFPMDRQSCPLILGSYAYTKNSIVYEWQSNEAVKLVPGMTLSQFDLISMSQRNYTYERREGEFSVVQVSFNLKRHTGYFLIQVYVPCILIVVLSWVSFWIHREATSDRVGLGITTVLTLSTISLDSRTDLPKVRYATALDWFLLMSFFYCIATLLEFAGVHYFTKVGSGEINALTDDEWEDVAETIEHAGTVHVTRDLSPSQNQLLASQSTSTRKRNSIICPIYNDPTIMFPSNSTHSTMERTTQTEPPKAKKWKQIWLCFLGDDKFRRQRQREATEKSGNKKRYINSVSLIDRSARIGFPLSFGILILLYWLIYVTYQDDFPMIKEQKRIQ